MINRKRITYSGLYSGSSSTLPWQGTRRRMRRRRSEKRWFMNLPIWKGDTSARFIWKRRHVRKNGHRIGSISWNWVQVMCRDSLTPYAPDGQWREIVHGSERVSSERDDGGRTLFRIFHHLRVRMEDHTINRLSLNRITIEEKKGWRVMKWIYEGEEEEREMRKRTRRRNSFYCPCAAENLSFHAFSSQNKANERAHGMKRAGVQARRMNGVLFFSCGLSRGAAKRESLKKEETLLRLSSRFVEGAKNGKMTNLHCEADLFSSFHAFSSQNKAYERSHEMKRALAQANMMGQKGCSLLYMWSLAWRGSAREHEEWRDNIAPFF